MPAHVPDSGLIGWFPCPSMPPDPLEMRSRPASLGRALRLGLWAVLGAGAFVVAGALVTAMLPELCANTEAARVDHPAGRGDVVLFRRNCGATTGFSAHVTLVAPGTPVDGLYGDALVATGDPLREGWSLVVEDGAVVLTHPGPTPPLARFGGAVYGVPLRLRGAPAAE